MAAKVDPELAHRLEGDPDALLEAIVMAQDALDDLLASLPAGIVVDHSYRLIRGLAVTASAGTLRRLALLPAVKSIEPVRDVQAW